METNYYQSDLAIHPGEYLEEVLEETMMSQSDLSHRIGRPTQAINEIINGKKSITPETALQFEQVLDVPAHIWTGLQNEYNLILAKEKEIALIKEETNFLSNFPYLDLLKMGLVKETRSTIERVAELKKFLKVSTLAQIKDVKEYEPAYRVTDHKNVSSEALATWLHSGRLLSEKVKTELFNKKKLEGSLTEIKDLMNLEDLNDAIKGIKKLLSSCGVALVMIPHFKGTRVSGATFWSKDKTKAILLMTLRGSYSDIFWFNFFHELGHILLHNKREIFLEDGYNNEKLKKQEDEANKFSREFLINKDSYKEFINKPISPDLVKKFAKDNNIKPSIIIGRLMKDEIIHYSDYHYTSLRDRYKFA